MTSRRYRRTLNRQQEMRLPAHIEDSVSETNVVRAIDVYVNTPDLQDLEFKNSQAVIRPGQPDYPTEA